VSEHYLCAVELLLQAGTDPRIRTRIDNSETPRELAEEGGLQKIAELLGVLEVRQRR